MRLNLVVFLCLLACSLTVGGRTATLLQNRTITKFLGNLTSMPGDHPLLKNVTGTLINKARESASRCLQRSPDGLCLWKLVKGQRMMTKREASVVSKTSTKQFAANFIKNFALKLFPKISQHISSIFANDSSTLLNLPTDTVSRIETATNLILLKSVQKTYDALDQLRTLKVPLLTLSSLIIFLVILLVASCLARQIADMRTRRSINKQRRLEAYYERRTMQEQLNQQSPSYEAVALQ